MLFLCPIQVSKSLLPTIGFTSFRIKTVVFWMILICDVVFVLVFSVIVVHMPDTEPFLRVQTQGLVPETEPLSLGVQYQTPRHCDKGSMV